MKLSVDFNVEMQSLFTQTKPSQTHTPTQTQQPLRYQTPRHKPNLEYRCQDLALKENQKHCEINLFFLPIRHSPVDLQTHLPHLEK